MKQLLFLLLFPCLALAQYQGNSNQKITLGEQTTADGLVFRGVAYIDTVTATSKITRANKQDTSAYLLLDTVTNLLWHYKIGSNAWTQAGGSTLDTATMLLPYYRAGRNTIIQAADVPTLNQNTTGSAATLTTGRTIQTNLASTSAATFNGSANITPGVTGTLPVANGGTNTSTAFTAGSVVFAGTSGTYAQDNGGLFYDNTNDRLGIGTATPTARLHVKSAGISNATSAFIVKNGIDSTLFEIIDGGGFKFVGSVNIIESTYTPEKPGGFNALSIFQNANTLVLSGGSSGFQFNNNANSGALVNILNDGKVGIGETSPAVQFHTTGGVRFAGLASITDLRTDADGDLFNGSDFNLKNSIDTINFGLSDVLKLKPVSFNWNDEQRNINEYKSMGFIAQDVMNIIPNAASTMGDGDMQVDYNAIVATLTKAIQEQQAIIKALEQRIINLENK